MLHRGLEIEKQDYRSQQRNALSLEAETMEKKNLDMKEKI